MSDFPLQLQSRLQALYRSIGSSERLEQILRIFYERMSQDLMLGFFFVGHDLDQIATRQTSFILRAMGVTPSYTGKPPAQAHTAMPPILPGHFDRRLILLAETLAAEGLSPEDIRTWVDFEAAFRSAVVTET